MIKKCWLALMLALCALIMVGCSRKEELHIYSWADYISPELISEFESLNNCRVFVDTFDSNEMMYSKLQAGGTGYDIIIPSHYFVKKMAKSGLIMKLDKEKLPALANVDPAKLQGLGEEVTDYAIPYFMGATGLGYNKSIKGFQPTWNVFYRVDLKGYMTLLDDYNEVIGAAMVTQGLTVADLLDEKNGDANLEKVVQQAISWLDNVIKFENEQYKNGLAAGEFKVVMGYSSDLGQVVMENPDTLAFAMPKEGCLYSCDVLVVSSKSPQPDLAYKFINFIHEPLNAAKNMEDVVAYCPNLPAEKLINEETVANPAIAIFLDPAMKDKKQEFVPELTPEHEQRFLKAWNKIKQHAD